jgi:hypothetical protein
MPARFSGFSIRKLLALYATLPPVPVSARAGSWRAGFVGPWWLRWSAAPAIALGGMPGWHGKRFAGTDAAVNLLRSPAGLREVLPMRCSEQPSWHDGRPCTVLAYGARARIPWRWVRDELRQLDEGHWLCLTWVDLPLLRRLACPFLLVHETDPQHA